MNERFYTLALWRVKPGCDDDFKRVWVEELAEHFLALNPSARGTLIQSLEDPNLFYSFGPWASMEEMEAIRTDAHTAELIAKLSALCDEAKPGPFEVIAVIPA